MPNLNTQYFMFQHEAARFCDKLIPEYATMVGVLSNEHGYYLNVHWNCGIIAPMTVQEYDQALGE